MKSKFNQASVAAVAAMLIALAFSADGSGAAAEERNPVAVESEPVTQFISVPVVQPLPAATEQADAAQGEYDTQPAAVSLVDLVASYPKPAKLSREMHCLAGAIYFEARGESLDGQLAVGSVIVERARSQRFPDSYCGVVFQRSQFSFVRGNRMPKIKTGSRAWRRAVAIAQIADGGRWESPAEGAMYFHAARVSPAWRLTRVARVDNHVFYR
jgi:spore germination cell wall hydrolase CwlJ-like protein